MTAAVRGGSLRASRTWSQRPKLVQGSLEPVESLALPPPPSLPFLSLLSGVFLDGILMDRPPQTFFLLFFHVFLSSCLFILILSFSCAYYRPDLSLRTYTHAYSILTTRFRWPRFVTMRFGSSVVPLHLVLLHRQPHTPLSVSSFSFSSVPFACACALPPFRAGWRPHMPPFREACVCV